MTPAEELRTAAARIRHVATAAPDGPWEYRERRELFESGTVVYSNQYNPPYRVVKSIPETCRHIALWDPIAAEHVARLLESQAVWHERNVANAYSTVGYPEIDLARSINGGAS